MAWSESTPSLGLPEKHRGKPSLSHHSCPPQKLHRRLPGDLFSFQEMADPLWPTSPFLPAENIHISPKMSQPLSSPRESDLLRRSKHLCVPDHLSPQGGRHSRSTMKWELY